jgi:hypothetical protein
MAIGQSQRSGGGMFEYTDDHITAQFRNGGNLLLDRLTALPCLFCGEGTTDETAYVGQINRARLVGNEVVLEVTFDADVPPLQNSVIFANRSALDMSSEWEFSRNHWAVKGDHCCTGLQLRSAACTLRAAYSEFAVHDSACGEARGKDRFKPTAGAGPWTGTSSGPGSNL